MSLSFIRWSHRSAFQMLETHQAGVSWTVLTIFHKLELYEMIILLLFEREVDRDCIHTYFFSLSTVVANIVLTSPVMWLHIFHWRGGTTLVYKGRNLHFRQVIADYYGKIVWDHSDAMSHSFTLWSDLLLPDVPVDTCLSRVLSVANPYQPVTVLHLWAMEFSIQALLIFPKQFFMSLVQLPTTHLLLRSQLG